MGYPNKANKFEGHRVWYFIETAKSTGRDTIDFPRPVSTLANRKYEDLALVLKEKGYVVSGVSSPTGSSVGVMQISNIMGV